MRTFSSASHLVPTHGRHTELVNTLLKVLLGLLLVLPLGAYITGTLVASQADVPTHRDPVVVDGTLSGTGSDPAATPSGAGMSPSASPSPRGDDDPDDPDDPDDSDDSDDSDDEVRVIRPTPHEVEDEAADDSGRGSGSNSGSGSDDEPSGDDDD